MRGGIDAAALQRAAADAAVLDGLHEPGVLEHLDVFQDRSQRHRVRFRKLADRRRPAAQPRHDVDPSGICKRRECVINSPIHSEPSGSVLAEPADLSSGPYRYGDTSRRKYSTCSGASGVFPRMRSDAFSASIITGA